ncbi:MAG: restriction endonuclease subunit S [Bacteroidales bacterium]|nr:restriction endonuclease subunit S [Bacteroidales bacterium]
MTTTATYSRVRRPFSSPIRARNHNLEQQAQALYRSWFVDFEPFKGGKFVESELGMIPEGWRVGYVNTLIDIQSGFAFKSETFTKIGEYRLITIKAVQDGYLETNGADQISIIPAKMPKYCILSLGDILLSLTGNVGRVCLVDQNKLLLNQRVAKIHPKDETNRFFSYCLFRNEEFKNTMIQLARGTAQLNLSPVETGYLKIVCPNDETMKLFSKVGLGIFNNVLSNRIENIRLSLLRDSILPKLMSGELNINEFDC